MTFPSILFCQEFLKNIAVNVPILLIVKFHAGRTGELSPPITFFNPNLISREHFLFMILHEQTIIQINFMNIKELLIIGYDLQSNLRLHNLETGVKPSNGYLSIMVDNIMKGTSNQ